MLILNAEPSLALALDSALAPFVVRPCLHFAAAAALVLWADWLGSRAWRRAAGAHWAERARLLWPARVTSGSNVFLVPAILLLVQRQLGWPADGSWLLDGAAATIGVFAGSYWFDRQVFPRMTLREWRRQIMFGWSFRIGIWMLLVLATVAMPAEPGWKMAAVALAFLTPYLALLCGMHLPLLRWLGALSAPSARMQSVVDCAAAVVGVYPKAVWGVSGVHAVAFALPTRQEVILSERLMEVCSDEEVAAVCGHELEHLQESKAALAGRIVGGLALAPVIFARPAYVHFESLGLLNVVACVALIKQFAHWLSRRLERRADRRAVSLGQDEGVFARALETLYRENQLPAVAPSRRETHPHLYDRMIAAGVTPDFPRPKAAGSTSAIGAVYWVVLGILLAIELGRYEAGAR